MWFPAHPPKLTALVQEGKLYFPMMLSGRTAGRMLPKLMLSPSLLPAKLQGPQLQRRAISGTSPGSMARRPTPSLQGLHKLGVLSNTLPPPPHPTLLSVLASCQGLTPRGLFQTRSH